MLPTVSAVLIVYAVAVAGSFGLFVFGESLGLVCGGERPEPVFDTKTLCHATGVSVTDGFTYKVTLKTTGPWWDGYRDDAHPGIKVGAGPNGFGWNDMTGPMVAGLPLRRHLTQSWFRVIVRVGETGRDNQPLSFTPHDGAAADEKIYTATFKARSNGTVFLFVNDSVIGWPGVVDLFYSNNKGTAEVTITPVPDPARERS